ncbi:hypothetical protein MKW98_024219 [Papaver atlanticum]|uniref:RING-type domain-containing protein n=1 Tax=Papaver atlanticum TaxID=357466 RepID=A0AAD4SY01_9MAGN|nr:hypothetical protein MKW98_024219 [Papaver atlanticum]
MESTSRSYNFESSMETDGTTSTRVSLEMAGSTTITRVVVSEHIGPGHYYTMERINPSRYELLPSIVHLFLNGILEPSHGDNYDSNHQIFVITNRTTNNIVEVDLIAQANRSDPERGFHRWCEICKNMIIRISEVRAAVEAMTKIYIIDNDEVARCSIFREEWRAGDDVRRTACGHEFHPSCIETWLIEDKQGSFPNCRFQLIPGRCSNCGRTHHEANNNFSD